MRGADILVQTLAKAGVRRIFGLSGNQIMPIFDACIDAGIEIVHTRHEAAAVFMADAFAQLTGQVGIALVTAAPGFANALGPLYSARASESPVLLLSGAAPIAQDGMGAFQELAQAEMAAAVTKLSFRASSAATLGKRHGAAHCAPRSPAVRGPCIWPSLSMCSRPRRRKAFQPRPACGPSRWPRPRTILRRSGRRSAPRSGH